MRAGSAARAAGLEWSSLGCKIRVQGLLGLPRSPALVLDWWRVIREAVARGAGSDSG